MKSTIRKIRCVRRQQLRRPDITAPFRRWYGKPLRWHERSAVYTMERQRRRRSAVRVHIVDPAGKDNTAVIIAYIRWLQHLSPHLDTAVVARTKAAARGIGRSLLRKPVFTGSCRRPDSLRGTNYKICLVDNLSPGCGRAVNIVVSPVIDERCPGGALIYHTSSGVRADPLPCNIERQLTLAAYRRLPVAEPAEEEEKEVALPPYGVDKTTPSHRRLRAEKPPRLRR